MANIKSAKKRLRVIARKTMRNKALKSNLKTVLKKADAAIAAGGSADTESAVRLAVKKVDQAAAKGILHKNKAARKKSQLSKKLNSVKP